MTKTDQMRLTARRLRVLHRAELRPRTVAATCRYFGLSRKVVLQMETAVG